MAGDTEEMEYDDHKITLEYEWKLDLEVQDLILKQRREHSNRTANADSNRIHTDGEDDTMSTTINKIAQKS
jgi:hypothetical protein